MLNAEKSGKFRPGNFSIRNDDCGAEVLALPALSSSSLLTALKRTGRQICVSRVLLLLLLLLLGVTMLTDRRCLGFAELYEKLLKYYVLQDFVCMNWLVL